MVDQRSWMHMLSVISRGCVWEIDVCTHSKDDAQESPRTVCWRQADLWHGLLEPLLVWWTPFPRGLRQCWKIMVATQNIDILGPIWTFSLRGVLTFVASGLDINGCVLSYFEGTADLHCYTSCTLTTLHCNKVLFLQCCHMKSYNTKCTKIWGVYSLLWDTIRKWQTIYYIFFKRYIFFNVIIKKIMCSILQIHI